MPVSPPETPFEGYAEAVKKASRGADVPRVLLIWPGGVFAGAGSFGSPQLLSLAAAIKSRCKASVDVIDFDLERALGPIDLGSLLASQYDLIGISCYSSYDYLKVMAIGQAIKRLSPSSWLVTGGYHASACPEDFGGRDSPFDYVAVGDGEGPLARLVNALSAGRRPLQQILPAEPLHDLKNLRCDWSLLERYRKVAPSVASQAEIYLSRGCPFDCAFCMERAKREVSWRALEPVEAVEEIHRLDQFIDLSGWTLFIADALFGLKTSWRREFLERLIKRPCRARRIWALTRVDLLEHEDLKLMVKANVSPGFGLESGDEAQLSRIRKTGNAEALLEQMQQVARWATALNLPFGANVIVGHPGETEASLRKSASYLRQLFLSGPTTGFLSVDAFRLYPGSGIADDLPQWQRRTGMRAHRYPWWHDGDQDFLAEWIDPSDELDFRRTLSLRRELFDPIVMELPQHFSYQGPTRDYFLRAVEEQVALCHPRHHLHTLGMWHLWRSLNARDDGTAATSLPVHRDSELAKVAKDARAATLEHEFTSLRPAIRTALHEVPRERFVSLEHVSESAADKALPLGNDDLSTISAMHAYATVFEALQLGPEDSYVELGAGTGYGAALACELVGPAGRVLAFECQTGLAEQARRNLESRPQARLLPADAHETSRWSNASKVYAAFAIREVPQAWLDALAPGGRLIAPVGAAQKQALTLFEKTASGIGTTVIDAVRYVPDRRAL